jgi:hypothetical protein
MYREMTTQVKWDNHLSEKFISTRAYNKEKNSQQLSASRVNSNNSSLFVLDSIITSDAMKAANSIGIDSVNPLCSGFCI